MMPSFMVPKPVRAPRKEFRVEKPAHDALPLSTFAPPFAPQSGLSKLTDCSSCQMNFKPGLRSRSPRKPRYEFCVSTALRAPGVLPVTLQPPVFVVTAPVVDAPQMPVPETRVETWEPAWVPSLLVP